MKFAPLVSYQMSALGPFSLFAADGLVKLLLCGLERYVADL